MCTDGHHHSHADGGESRPLRVPTGPMSRRTFAQAGGGLLLLFGAAFGGLSFALYPLCVAHANDRLLPAERVSASGQLVLLYSAGAALGPLGGAAAMNWMGPGGLFLFIAACAAAMLGFSLWRLAATAPVPGPAQQDFQMLPRTTPVAALLDPSGPEAATVKD